MLSLKTNKNTCKKPVFSYCSHSAVFFIAGLFSEPVSADLPAKDRNGKIGFLSLNFILSSSGIFSHRLDNSRNICYNEYVKFIMNM